MDVKQYISEWPTGHWRNQRNPKISRNKEQWKHNSKPVGCTKNSVKREFIAIQAYFKKQEKTNKPPNLTRKPTRKRIRRKTTATTTKEKN